MLNYDGIGLFFFFLVVMVRWQMQYFNIRFWKVACGVIILVTGYTIWMKKLPIQFGSGFL